MTEKLYYEDAYIKEFNARVLSCEENGKNFKIILDKTAFFPEGGGQKAGTSCHQTDSHVLHRAGINEKAHYKRPDQTVSIFI